MAGFIRSGKVRIWGSRSKDTTILIRVMISQENRCQSQEKSGFSYFFASEDDFGQKLYIFDQIIYFDL